MGEHYASGDWQVRAGSEDEFIARWNAFLTESTGSVQGFGSARLLRDKIDSRHFVSVSDWADAASRDKWQLSPKFEAGLASCRELCHGFVGGDYSQVASL